MRADAGIYITRPVVDSGDCGCSICGENGCGIGGEVGCMGYVVLLGTRADV